MGFDYPETYDQGVCQASSGCFELLDRSLTVRNFQLSSAGLIKEHWQMPRIGSGPSSVPCERANSVR